MGTFDRLQGWFSPGHSPATPADRLLDRWISESLHEEAETFMPVGAWDRLRNAIVERRPIKGYGMWVLDELPHDPPDTPTTTLTERQLKRALRIYGAHIAAEHWQARQAAWGNWAPSFAAVVNL